ncbi:hypothetical protein AMAG_06395 [Allomyces macrogynus ATCC 38327]|uniref:Uncharacterized protein n=1 Tax=Allomyces macrogynus (strain ATCC 38327) TaxID=578462 RepID=A0A0L0SGE8_ALLM3|nr:hypothetical protein AMAG_06395 [Allomyces macrogynus ATCC 38327]|eukprot:KNE61583.1 hypothetical protein AMAG_06395 [Allomyces macrogynus ATCC 38327]
MISKTVRFTTLTTPAAGVAPILARAQDHEHAAGNPRAAVTLSGNAIALFDVRDVKRVAVWASHPKTVFASNAVIHAAAQRVYVPVNQHMDLPRSASRKTIWSWPCAADSSQRKELRMDDIISSLFAPACFSDHLVVVHDSGAVSLITLDLALVTSTTPLLPTPPARGHKVVFAQILPHPTRSATMTVVVVVSNGKSTHTVAAATVSEAAGVQPLFSHQLAQVTGALVDTALEPAKAQLSLLLADRVVSYRLNFATAGLAPMATTTLPAGPAYLKLAALPNYVAVLARSNAEPAPGKSAYSVHLYELQFGTCQGKTTFDADILEHLHDNQGKLPATVRAAGLLAVDDHVLACLVLDSAKRGPSKAVLLRSEVRFPALTLMSVLGKSAAATTANAAAPAVHLTLPASDDVQAWKQSVQAAHDVDTKFIRAIDQASTAAALEQAFFEHVKQAAAAQARESPRLAPAVTSAVVRNLLDRAPVFSRRVLEYLLKHALITDAMAQDGLLKHLADLALPPVFFELTLRNVVDLGEANVVDLIIRLIYTVAPGAVTVAGDGRAPLTMEAAAARRVLVLALAYPHTDVFVHDALCKLDSTQALVLLRVLSELVRTGNADKAIPWLSHLLDAHFVTLLLNAPANTTATLVRDLLDNLEPLANSSEAEQDMIGALSWFLMHARRRQEQLVADKYVAMDGTVRSKKAIVQREKYTVEVVHF